MSKLYLKAIETLTSKGKFHICLGLDRISKVLELLDNPQEKIKIIHVAGTNGKGSVCAMLSSVLKTAGYKTGMYTSPHLFDYNERIKIDNIDIPQDDFAKYVLDICSLADENSIHLTEFEILTACAYKYFFDKKVDIAVIETGLGGRLDATNVIKSNLLSIITSISIDHADRLGDTIDQIAREKAGIVKESCSLVISPDNYGYGTIKKAIEHLSINLINPSATIELKFEKGVNYAFIDGKRLEFPLLGLCQKENLRLVVEAVRFLKQIGYKISDEQLFDGLKEVKWPARMQYIKEKNILIDGAHNLDGAKKLIESIEYYFPDEKRIWIYGSLNTKDYVKITDTLFREGDEVYICEFNNKNSIKFEDIKLNKNIILDKINISKAENMLNYYQPKCLKIISGSFYMIGEFFNSLKT